MAKDRERLFKGADDKAITFQRAVFIVCNLKRLIKRPKKDDKQGNANARKRSGAGGGSSSGIYEDDDEQCGGTSGGGGAIGSRRTQRGAGAKEPVRRAFTLPAMLCGTFGGFVAPVLANSVAPPPEHCASVIGARLDRLDQVNQVTDMSEENQQAARLLQTSGNNNNSEFVASPLACLATPVRRAATAVVNQQLLGYHRPTHQSVAFSKADSTLQQPDNHVVDEQQKQQLQQQQWQFQVCCPIWLQLMNELDAGQRQPRDQTQHAHLVWPPSRAGYLAAPVTCAPALHVPHVEPPEVLVSCCCANGGRQSAVCVGGGGGNGNGRGDEDTSADCATATATDHMQRRSSDESAEKSSHRKQQQQQQLIQYQQKTGDGGKKATSSHKQAPISPSSDVGPRNSNEQRDKNQSSGCDDDPNYRAAAAANQHLDTDIDQMRMKRFSSALCLNDQPAPSLATGARNDRQYGAARGQAANHHQGANQHQHQRQSATATGAPAATLHAPDDPTMALARQRRPSAGNQGSVNVEQQALFSAVECNQLERARSILDQGKANVNSLNGDKLTCLDIAVLMRNVDMVKLLQQYNAKESSAYLSHEGRANQLYALYMEARRLVEDLSRSLQAIAPPQQHNSFPSGGHYQQQQYSAADQSNVPSMLATGSLLSTALLEEKQRQLQYWKRRLDLFMHMRYQFERLQVPNAPELIVLQVVGEDSLGVKIVHSLKSNSSSIRLPTSPHITSATNAAVAAAAANEFQAATAAKHSGASEHVHVPTPLPLPANRLLQLPKCLQGPNCSHWQLAEFCAAAEWQQRELRAKRLGAGPISGATPDTTLASSDANSAARQRQQHQQQKLAVFNQLLAQQLTLLSYQQQQQQHQFQMQMQQRPIQFSSPHANPSSRGNQRGGGGSSDSESVGSSLQSLEPTVAVNQQAQFALVEPSALDLQHCPSIAYQLITSAGNHQRHAGHLFGQVGPQMSVGGLSTVACSDSLAASGGRIAAAVGGLKIGGGGQCDNSDVHSAASGSTDVIITKYKIEWSSSERMDPILDSMIVYNNNIYPLECQINGLINGQLYYVQVSSGNHRGFCEPRPTSPVCLAPSSWRQVEGNRTRRRCDEEVFRKLTKLILLNKHILDDHQACDSSAPHGLIAGDCRPTGQHTQLQQSSAGGGGGYQPTKSSLINMLLLDATSPVATASSGGGGGGGGGIEQLARRENGHLVVDPASSVYPGSLPIGATVSEQQQQQQSSTSMRKNLKNLFQSNTFKFHKLNNQNKRGLYLTTVVYYTPHSPTSASAASSNSNCGQSKQSSNMSVILPSSSAGDKIVVTNDDRLPIIEVVNDLVAPVALMSDFYWLLKINGTQWMDIKRLRQQLQKSHSSSTLHLRIKLLAAIEQMQLALNMEDIGRIFYKPIQAHDGSIVICTCRRVANTKMVSSLSTKWTHQHKIIPRHLRKISDSMLNSAAEQQQHQHQHQHSRSSVAGSGQQSSREWRTGSQVMGRGTGESLVMAVQQPAEFRLCETCQHQLIQRRSTMASGSSNSSLASSNDSQWSVSGGGGGCTASGTSYSFSCQQCRNTNRSSSSATSFMLSAPGSQRGSTCTTITSATTASLNTTGGGSGRCSSINPTLGTPTHHSTLSVGGGSIASPTVCSATVLSGRNSSQPSFSAAQKSSTYLMLASLSLYDLLLFHMNEIIHFDQSSTRPLTRGLYLGLVQLQTTVESMRLLVPRSRPNMVPFARIRDNAHVSREEWQLLKLFANINRNASGASPAAAVQVDDHHQKQGAVPDSASLAVTETRSRAQSVSPGCRDQVSSPMSSQQQQQQQRHLQQKKPSPQQLVSQCSRSHEQIRGSRQSDSMLLDPNDNCNCNNKQQVVGGTNSHPSAATAAHSDTDLSLGGGGGAMATKTCSGVHSRRRCDHLSETDASTSGVSCARRLDATACSEPSLDISSSSAVSSTMSLSHMVHEANEQAIGGKGPDRKVQPTIECDPASCDSTAKRTDNDNTAISSINRAKSPTSIASHRLTVYSGNVSGAGLLLAASQSAEETFVRLVGSAAKRLLAELRSQLPKYYDEQTNSMLSILQSLNDEENNRIYHLELIELSNQVSFILLIPAPENVCPVTSHEKSNILGDNKEYMLLPLQIFETIHINTYEPDLLGKYSRLSAILETDLVVAQHDHRQAFSSNELKSTKSRVSNLQEMVTIADEFWRKLRWIVDVVSFARDKSPGAVGGGIKLGPIWRYFEPSLSSSYHGEMQSITAAGRRCSGSTGGVGAGSSQLQVAARAGLEVKRTASAKATGAASDASSQLERVTYEEKAASLTVMDSVPEIHLSGGWQPASSGAQISSIVGGACDKPAQTCKSAAGAVYGRRHSGGAAIGSSSGANSSVSSCKTLLGDNRQLELVKSRVQCVVSVEEQKQTQTDAQEMKSISGRGADKDRGSSSHNNNANFTSNNDQFADQSPAEPMQLLQMDGSEDEDNAIYAYHLSLKDATKAAAQRKCSQQSTKPMVATDEEATTSSSYGNSPPPAALILSGPSAGEPLDKSAAIRKSSAADPRGLETDLHLDRQQKQQQHELIATSCDWAFSSQSQSAISTPSSSSCASQKLAQSGKIPLATAATRCGLRIVDCSDDKASGGDNSSDKTIVGRDDESRKRRQFKSNNPFLTDSIDFAHENEDPNWPQI